MELHQPQRQTVGIGVVLAVFRGALFQDLRARRKKRQAVFNTRAYVEECCVAVVYTRRRWRTSCCSCAATAATGWWRTTRRACTTAATTTSARAAREFPDTGKIRMSVRSFRRGAGEVGLAFGIARDVEARKVRATGPTWVVRQ